MRHEKLIHDSWILGLYQCPSPLHFEHNLTLSKLMTQLTGVQLFISMEKDQSSIFFHVRIIHKKMYHGTLSMYHGTLPMYHGTLPICNGTFSYGNPCNSPQKYSPDIE